MHQVMGRKWMVSAGHPLAAQAAARILEAGGNAIDAGVAAGFMLGVVHLDMVSFAGVAPILVHLAATGETFEVSGVGPYPRKADRRVLPRPARRADSDGRAPHRGARVAGLLVRGARAVGDALRFRDVVAPALECAERGFPALDVFRLHDQQQCRALPALPDVGADSICLAGEPPAPGELLRADRAGARRSSS